MPKRTKRNAPSQLVRRLPVISDIWENLPGLIFKGKPVHIAYALYERAHVDNVIRANTQKFVFTTFNYETRLLTRGELNALSTEDKTGMVLGVVIVTDLGCVGDANVLNGDTLPFVPGANIQWRNPKTTIAVTGGDAETTPGWVTHFTDFENIILVEQVQNPAGWSPQFHQSLNEALNALYPPKQ